MSVSVYVEALHTGAFTATCFETDTVLTAADNDGIILAMTAHKMGCEECSTYGIYANAVVDVDVTRNMSNVNANEVFRTLGIDLDLCGGGSTTGQDFLGAVLLAQATLGEDTGVPAAEYIGDGRARMIDCGMRPGYLTEALDDLRVIAQTAADLGRDVVWN